MIVAVAAFTLFTKLPLSQQSIFTVTPLEAFTWHETVTVVIPNCDGTANRQTYAIPGAHGSFTATNLYPQGDEAFAALRQDVVRRYGPSLVASLDLETPAGVVRTFQIEIERNELGGQVFGQIDDDHKRFADQPVQYTYSVVQAARITQQRDTSCDHDTGSAGS